MKRSYFGEILTLFALGMIIFGASVAANAQAQYRKALDFNGDGKADITTLRQNSDGGYQWYSLNVQNNSYTSTQWGASSGLDRVVSGDYDGDGKADQVNVRINLATNSLTWYIRRSQTNTLYAISFGAYNPTTNMSDAAIPADYDGDGKTDIAVVRRNFVAGNFRPVSFNWYYLSSLTGQVGGSGVVPVAVSGANSLCYPTSGDFNGDGRADYVHTCRNSETNSAITWDVVLSSSGARSQTQWGLASDQMASGDYDGDGKTDLGVARFTPIPGGTDKQLIWYILQSFNQVIVAKQFGGSFNNDTVFDIVVPADYDGDGKTDIAVVRTPGETTHQPVTYYFLQSLNNQVRGVIWGFSDDYSMQYGRLNAAANNAAS